MSDRRRNPAQAREYQAESSDFDAVSYDAFGAMATAQRDLAATVRTLQETVQELALTVQAVRSQMPTQESIQREIEKRVDKDAYRIAHEALQSEMRDRDKARAEDIADLKTHISGAWQRAAPWVAIGVAVLGNLATFALGSAALVVSLTHH